MQEVTGSTPVFSTNPEFVRGFFMPYFTYIIYSSTADKYYVGHTDNVEKRLGEHIARRNLGASDRAIKHTETHSTRAEAARREREIKSKKSRRYIEWLISSNA